MTITSRDDIDNMMRFAIKGAIFGSAVGLSLGVYFCYQIQENVRHADDDAEKEALKGVDMAAILFLSTLTGACLGSSTFAMTCTAFTRVTERCMPRKSRSRSLTDEQLLEADGWSDLSDNHASATDTRTQQRRRTNSFFEEFPGFRALSPVQERTSESSDLNI